MAVRGSLTVNKTNPQTESFANSIIESRIGFVVASATGPTVKYFMMSARQRNPDAEMMLTHRAGL